MAERADSSESLLTPLSAMEISPRAPTRPRSTLSPSGTTPRPKRSARMTYSARKHLCFQDNAPGAEQQTWSDDETQALLEFLLFHKPPGAVWFRKGASKEFWKAAAEFVRTRTCKDVLKTGIACRLRVVAKLRKRFSTPEEALQFYQTQQRGYSMPPPLSSSGSPQDKDVHPNSRAVAKSVATQTDDPCELHAVQSSTVQVGDVVNDMKALLRMLSQADQSAVLCELFKSLVEPGVPVPDSFVSDAIACMVRCHRSGRLNILALLAKALGTMRSDGTDSLMPVSRMPVGLIEYVVSFFSAETMYQVTKCPDDYRQWCETMYCLFGTKWSKIHTGPLWSVEAVTQDGTQSMCFSRKPCEARVNIPAPSTRTLQRHIAASDFTSDASIQVTVLDEANKAHPGVWWWVKGDGCDLTSGLGESVSHEWSGDEDLCDGKLPSLYSEYRHRRQFAENLGMQGREGRWDISIDLHALEGDLTNDIDFLTSALTSANQEYSSKVASGTASEKVLHKCAWQVDDLSHLNEDGRQLLRCARELQDLSDGSEEEFLFANVPLRLCDYRKKLLSFLQSTYRFKRTPATHIFVLMISPEQRNRKPYALPVQCVPYTSLKHKTCRKLLNDLITEMHNRQMKVAGFTTDGEFNSLRCKGNTRPLSVLQLKANSRAKYGAMKLHRMQAMLSPKRLSDGSVVAEEPNPIVPNTILREILLWKEDGVSDEEVYRRLRPRTVPRGYNYTNWKAGKTESFTDVLRSILAQLDFTYTVRDYHDRQGVPFRHHLYVPEVHPITHEVFCEREDEAHVLKRIATSTRLGGPVGIQLERFMEALHDPQSQLTYTALTGSRKQSVTDAECLFSPSVLAFMQKKGYTFEAKYVQTVLNWRRASDERGLTEVERSRFNHEMLEFIIDDLMPWHKEYDFSMLEVNRKVNSVCGFTRETLNAMIANIEGREIRRQFLASSNLRPEHPRACSTDDVECFFSVLRDTVGSDFSLKRVRHAWKHACLEFTKRTDPKLPFYYYTSAHDRFHEGPRPHFDVPSRKKPHRVRRSELLVGQAPGRTTLPVPGSRSLRMTYHNVLISIPPLPGQVSDHTYA